MLLTEYRLRQSNVSGETFLFTTSKGYLYHAGAVDIALSGFLKRRNIDLNVTPHILRHTFATRCVENGFDVKALSEILGHANVSTTLQRYVHPSMDSKREQIERLASSSIYRQNKPSDR